MATIKARDLQPGDSYDFGQGADDPDAPYVVTNNTPVLGGLANVIDVDGVPTGMHWRWETVNKLDD